MPQSSCLCGQNIITYTSEPILKFRCHCFDERKLTGAAFGLNILYSIETLEAKAGSLSTWRKTVENGNIMTNHCCSQCGSLLYRSSTGYPGMMVIKAGCIDGFDASRNFVPQVEIFTRSRLPWVPAVEGAKQEIADFTK
jgi:hypothetical protein